MMEEKAMMSVGGIDISMAAPVEGSPDAPFTIIEFGDYQCPKCDQWFLNEKPTVTKELLETGKANLYFLDFAFLGNDSDYAANASYCADEQAKYLEYHSHLYNNQGSINGGWANPDNLKGFAAELELDTVSFNECLDSGKYNDRVIHNKNVGTSHGVEGTPTFFIVSTDGSVTRIDGPQPAAVFMDSIK
jgi:protein-disulfide isomerase